jgi:hypothetical protein
MVDKWIKLFEKKSGTKFHRRWDEHLIYEESRGFIGVIVNKEEQAIVITKMVGDGEYWAAGIAAMLEDAEPHGIDKLFFTTYRNPRAFCRLLGGVIAGHEVKEDGRVLYQIISNLRMTCEALDRRKTKWRELYKQEGAAASSENFSEQQPRSYQGSAEPQPA